MKEIIKQAKEINQIAKDKGWWDTQRNHDEIHALIASELYEAMEADRGDKRANKNVFIELSCDYTQDNGELPPNQWKELFEAQIKDTIEDELADTAIRILDFLYFKNGEYFILPNINPEFADNFAENIFRISKHVHDYRIKDALVLTIKFAEHLDIDIEWHIKTKMKYNELREKRHGGKKY